MTRFAYHLGGTPSMADLAVGPSREYDVGYEIRGDAGQGHRGEAAFDTTGRSWVSLLEGIAHGAGHRRLQSLYATGWSRRADWRRPVVPDRLVVEDRALTGDIEGPVFQVRGGPSARGTRRRRVGGPRAADRGQRRVTDFPVLQVPGTSIRNRRSYVAPSDVLDGGRAGVRGGESGPVSVRRVPCRADVRLCRAA